jgi:PAS domain S-box-containing protein
MKRSYLPLLAGALLVAIGGAVLGGALLMPAELARLVPALRQMGLGTALCLVLQGTGLLLPPRSGVSGPLRSGIAVATAAVALLAISVPSIFLSGLPARWQDWPGAMSPATAIAFLAAAPVPLLAAHLRRTVVIGAVVALILIVLTLAILGVFGHLFGIAMFAGDVSSQPLMSWTTAFALAILVAGLTVRLAEEEAISAFYRDREDRRVLLAGILLAYALTMAAGLTGMGSVARQGIDAIQNHLGQSLQATARLIERELAEQAARTRRVIARRGLAEALLKADNGAALQAALAGIRAELAEAGAIAIVVHDGAGRLRGQIGELPDVAARLALQRPEVGALLWAGEWQQEIRIPLWHGTRAAGTAVVRLSAEPLHRQVRASSWLGVSGEILICADDPAGHPVCLPSRLRAAPFRLEPRADGRPWPMGLALAGQSGVAVIDDDRGVLSVCAYAPSASLGLGLALRQDATEFYRDLRDRLLMTSLAMLALVGAGALAIYWGLYPLVRERKRAEVALRRWLEIFEHAQWGVAIGSADGSVLEEMNPAFARMHGYSVEELKGQPIVDVFAPEVRTEVAEFIRRAHERGNYRFESLHRRRNGDAFPVQVDLATVRNPAGEVLYRIAHVEDISERKAAEAKLTESEHHLRQAQAQAQLGSWRLDLRRNILTWSDESYRIFGLQPGTPLDYETFLARVHPDDRHYVDRCWQAAIRGAHYDIRHRLRIDGKIKWVRERAEIEFAPDGSPLAGVGTTQDITESKEAEDELRRSRQLLRELAARRESVREEERARIAREVHDELGQLLTGLKMDIGALRLRVADQPELRDRLTAMGALADRTIGVVRHVASNLRPAVLDHGLVAALEWLAEDFERHARIPCLLAVENEIPPLDVERTTTLFRIVQESLTNVMRHAHAGHVDIALSCHGKHLRLFVGDDGRGFDAAETTGFGLLNLRERCMMFGGTCTIDSASGQGTRLRIEIPLESPATS